jgi:hypothetical protein
MSSDFNKSDSNSEVVIISPPRVDRDEQGLRVTKSGWSDFSNRVEHELNARPNMRLVSIQNIEKATDELGNLKSHTIGYMLIFEPRERTMNNILSELEDIREYAELIFEKQKR